MNERQVANKALELADWIKVTDFYENTEDHFINDTMDEVEAMLRSQEKYINLLHKLCNANGIGVGRNLLTGEVIPFEVDDERK